MQKELEEACRDTRGISPEDLSEDIGPAVKHSAVPTKAAVKFVSATWAFMETYFLFKCSAVKCRNTFIGS